MKTISTALIAAALALSGAASAQTVEKMGQPGARILTSARVKAGAETLYLSGTLASPKTPGGSDYGDTREQTISTLNNIKARLAEAGYSMKDIVRMDAFLVAAPGMDGKMDFAGFNAGFAEFFNTNENPTTTTRTTMQVAALAGPQFLVELTVVAAK